MQLELTASPFFKLPKDASIWKRQEENGASWWAIDLNHSMFGEGRPYNGVVHCEVLDQGDEQVVNLGVELENGTKVFSFGFPKTGDEMRSFVETEKPHALKALRIISELLHHYSDEGSKRGLSEKISKQSSIYEFTTQKKIWDSV